MKYSFYILFCISFIVCKSYSQQEATNWYFGYNAGLTFNLAKDTVEVKDDGQLNTIEGCASISNNLGELLFYTDGIIVYDKNHNIMDNGRGLFGDASSTQSALIVPKPNSLNIYYVFTVDAPGNFGNPRGFNYSIVDMSLNNGLGAVTSKNINLLDTSSEKVSAVLKDCQDGSIWVVTFANADDTIYGNFNTFYAYEITSSGVTSNPIKSTFPLLTVLDQRGYLKISPDGTKIALANFTSGLELFDFDTQSGKVSNQQSLSLNSEAPLPYGVEFSPNSQLLYVNAINVDFIRDTPLPSDYLSRLTQFNLAATNIAASEVLIDERQLYRGALQIGPNGKIYRALSRLYSEGLPYLGVINKPNAIGTACDYTHQAIDLSPQLSAQGLPPFIQSFFNTQIDIIKNGESSISLSLCDGESYTLSANLIPKATYTWTKDGNLLSETSNKLTVTKSGHYKLSINPNNGDCNIEGQAFVTVNPLPVATAANLAQCDDDTDAMTRFNLSEADSLVTTNISTKNISYFMTAAEAASSTNAVNKTDYTNKTNPETLYVRIENINTNCVNYTDLKLSVSTTNINQKEINACDNDGTEDGFTQFNLDTVRNEIASDIGGNPTIMFYETHTDALLEINNLANLYTNTTAYKSKIYVRVEQGNNCYGINTLTLIVNKLPNIPFTEETVLYCINLFPKTINLSSGLSSSEASNHTYLWSTGETSEQIAINKVGVYTVKITNSNMCSRTKTITVKETNIPEITSVETTEGFDKYSITVNVKGNGEIQYALVQNSQIVVDFQADNTFTNIAAGFYTVQVTNTANNCGITTQDVSIIGFPKFFTPNNDGYNDTWQVYGLNSTFYSNSVIYIFDRYGKLLKQLIPGNTWDGFYMGKPLPSDDYWFVVTLEDGREYKSHFSLRR